jgi:hypothetical protein
MKEKISAKHTHRFEWIKGKRTGISIHVCYGTYGDNDDFHVVKWAR